MPAVFDLGVCVRHWDWSETSQTVSIFTRERGIVRGIAKGARREHSAFSGGIELLTVGEVGLIVKQGRGDATLTTLTSWDVREHFVMPRRVLGCFNVGMAMADAVQRSMQEFDPHVRSFAALLEGLRGMEQGKPALECLVRFVWELASDLGYGLNVTRDVRTGAALVNPGGDAATVWFVPEEGGFTQQREVKGWGTRWQTVEGLRAIERGETLANPERAARLLGSYLTYVIEAEIPALQSVLDAMANPVSG
jgi:DNA repair protein RecO (recombination protein O)